MSDSATFSEQPGAADQPLTRRQLRERERASQHRSTRASSRSSRVAESGPRLSDALFSPSGSELSPTVPELFAPTPELFPRGAETQSVSPGSAAPIVTASGSEPTVAASAPAISVGPSESPQTSRRGRRAQRSVAPVVLAVATKRPARKRLKDRSTDIKSKRVWVSARALPPSGPPRRAKAAAKKVVSLGAMLFAGALLVGVSVPSNVFVSSEQVLAAASNDAASAAAVVASEMGSAQSLSVPADVASGVARHDDLKVISFAEVLAIKYADVAYEFEATNGAIRWPFPMSVPITDGFGDRWGGFHKGTDFAAGAGTPIYAIADGVVKYVQADFSGYGYNAIISHVIDGQQVESLYAHMVSDSSPLVVGDEIKVGDFVGLVGDTGISYGAHLHLEIHLDGVPVDPFVWLTANAV